MQRVVKGLDEKVYRDYNISTFVRDVWREELASIQLSPEAKCVLPKPLRSASSYCCSLIVLITFSEFLSCYDGRTLRRTIVQPLDEEKAAAELVWQATSPSAYAFNIQHAWEEVDNIEDTEWFRMQAFIEINGHTNCKQVAQDIRHVEDDCLSAVELKTAEFLLALMSSNVRSYTTGIVIRDFMATFWYVDRMGAVISKPFNILHEPYHLWAAGVAIAKTRSTPMGLCPLITFTSPRHVDFRQARLNADDVRNSQGVQLDSITLKSTGDEIAPHTAKDVVGRGTAVFSVVATGKTKGELGSEPLVAKVFWSAQHHHAEDAIIRTVRRSLKQKKPQYLTFITDLKCSLELSMDDLELPRASMSIPIPADERIFRMQVMPHYLPLVAIKSVSDFRIVFQDVVEGCISFRTPAVGPLLTYTATAHHWAFQSSGILHRDICINNIMLYYRDNKLFGILTGWDLAGGAIPRGQHTPTRRRFGTKPFISADTYAPWWTGEHPYRFDLESFYYVLAAFCAGFDPEKHTVRVPDDWLAESQKGKADIRRNLMKYLEALLQYAAPTYNALAWEWVLPLCHLFNKTIRAKYSELNSMHAIHANAVKKGDMALADETAHLIEEYLDDREKEVTYERFLECIGIDDPSGNPD